MSKNYSKTPIPKIGHRSNLKRDIQSLIKGYQSRIDALKFDLRKANIYYEDEIKFRGQIKVYEDVIKSLQSLIY
jgi:hypothetical protein